MSRAEPVTAAGPDVVGQGAGAVRPAARPGKAQPWAVLRLFRSELGLVFRRRRNQALLVVLAAVPILIGIALRLSHGGGNGGGPPLLFEATGNAVALTFFALSVLLTLVLPLTVAVVSGDSVAGEAGYGTLRYLLAVPAGRSRLLLVKYAVIIAFGLAASAVVAVAALLTGLALFPVGPVTLLSGTTIPLADGLLRLVYVVLYIGAAMAALGAIGLAISTLTEHPIGAIAAVAILVVGSQVVDNVPQFAVVHPYVPTHFWTTFDSLLRSPVATGDLLHGLLSFAAYAVIFGGFAWARFTTSDVSC